MAIPELRRAERKHRASVVISIAAETTVSSSPRRNRARGLQTRARAASDCPRSASHSSAVRLSRSGGSAGSPSQVRSSNIKARHRSRNGNPRNVARLRRAWKGAGAHGRCRRSVRSPRRRNSRLIPLENLTWRAVPSVFSKEREARWHPRKTGGMASAADLISRPPSSPPCSRSVTAYPRALSRSAVVSPAGPPPMMSTEGRIMLGTGREARNDDG